MAFDTTRRGFLKGLLAAAAIPVVAPLMPYVVEAEEIVEVLTPAEPTLEAGDVWVQLKGQWEFIGKARNITLPPRRTQVIDFGYLSNGQFLGERYAGRTYYDPQKVEFEIYATYDAIHTIRNVMDHIMDPSPGVYEYKSPMLLSFAEHTIALEGAYPTNIEHELNATEFSLVRLDVIFDKYTFKRG